MLYYPNVEGIKMGDVLVHQRYILCFLDGLFRGSITKDIDAAITNNIEVDRQCGAHDERLHKKLNIQTVPRGNMAMFLKVYHFQLFF